MKISPQARRSVGIAFGQLIDYAGLFPPAKLGMEAAVDQYFAARASANAWMLGRFIVPASRLDELVTVLRRKNADDPVAVAVIVDSDADHRRWFSSAQEMLAAIGLVHLTVPHVRIEALEAPLPPLATKRETFDASIGQFAAMAGQADLRDLPIYVEFPRDARWDELLPLSMGALARARLGAKLRCGGVGAEAFPSVAEVARFLDAAADEGVPWKATAGLHHPVRHLNVETGYPMHGFLNLLAAAAVARTVDESMLQQILAEEVPRSFSFTDDGMAWRDLHVTTEQLAITRTQRFHSYGSCSFTEPIDDLQALSILQTGH